MKDEHTKVMYFMQCCSMPVDFNMTRISLIMPPKYGKTAISNHRLFIIAPQIQQKRRNETALMINQSISSLYPRKHF